MSPAVRCPLDEVQAVVLAPAALSILNRPSDTFTTTASNHRLAGLGVASMERKPSTFDR